MSETLERAASTAMPDPSEPEASANGNGAPRNGHGARQPESPALQELKAIVEAVLFVSHEPVSLDRLRSVLEGASKADIQEAVRVLQEDYREEGRGLQLVELAGGYQLVTRPELAPWLKRLERAKQAPKLSRSALESLAIIAYKQPIVRAEIEQIRGVEVSGVLRTLLERKLIRIVGRKDEPGRPILYGTTKYFLQHFGLRDLSELPPLHEFKELGQSEQTDLPIGEDPLRISGTQESGPDDDATATDGGRGQAVPADGELEYLSPEPVERA